MSEKSDSTTKQPAARPAAGAAPVAPLELAAGAAPVTSPELAAGARFPGASSEALVHAPGLELPSHPGVPLSPTGVVPESDVRTHAPGAAANPHRASPLPDEHLGELPRGYGDGRLVCLVRDPSTLFVYWDLSQAQLEQAFGGMGAARAALKLLTLRGELVRELEIHLEARAWYIRQLPQAAELRVELWALGETGSRLLRASRPLRLPGSTPSSDFSAEYALVPIDAPLPREIFQGRPRTYTPALGAAWLVRQEMLDREARERESARLASATPARAQTGAAWNGNRSGEGR